MATKKNETECDICHESVPDAELIAHYKIHAKERENTGSDEPTVPKLGNTELKGMINKSDQAFITIRVLYMDAEPRPSENGPYRRAVIESVSNCKFEPIAYFVGTTVGKRMNNAIGQDKGMLEYQFELQLRMNSVNGSRPFVDVNDILLLESKKQLSAEEAAKYFPEPKGLQVHRK